MENIRQATKNDVLRLAEIEIFNYRINFYPIFKNDSYYFEELQVVSQADRWYADENLISNTYVYDDGVVKGFIRIDGNEIKKLFVEPILQGQSIGSGLLDYVIQNNHVTRLWTLEKNSGAIRFYKRHGFRISNSRKQEDGTTEYLVLLVR